MLSLTDVKSLLFDRSTLLAPVALVVALAATGCVAPETDGDHSPSTQVWEGAQVQAAFGADGVGPTLSYPHTFDRLGVQWDIAQAAGAEEPQLQIRTSAEGRIWSGWRDIDLRWAEDTARNGHHDVDGGRHTAAQLRLRGGATPAKAVRSMVVTPISEVGAGPASEDAGPADATGIEIQTFNLAPANLVRPRNAWNARQPACQSNSGQERVYIHHTVSPYNDNLAPEARMRGLQNFHMDSRGWCDLGYHYVVSRDGRIWQGRPENRLGAHVANRNSGSVGISFMGNFMEDRPNDDMLNSTGALVRWLRDTYGVDRNLLGHRDGGQTACPGDHLYARLDDIERIADNGAGGGGGGDEPNQGGATGVYRGVVFVAPDTNARLEGARVWVQGREGQAVRADADGHFSFDLSAGQHTVIAEIDGYQRGSTSREVAVGVDIWGSIGLTRGADPEPEPEPEPATPPEPVEDLAPTIVIEAPALGTVVHASKVHVMGRVFDDVDDRIAEVEVSGVGVATDGEGRFGVDIMLVQGANVIRAFAVDSAGNIGRAEVTVDRPAVDEPPVVQQGQILLFEHPVDGQTFVEPIVQVRARVLDSRIATVSLNGVTLPVQDGVVRTTVELMPGANRLTLEVQTPERDLVREVIIVRLGEAPAGHDGAGPIVDLDAGGDPGPQGSGGDVASELDISAKGAGSVGCAQAASYWDFRALLRR